MKKEKSHNLSITRTIAVPGTLGDTIFKWWFHTVDLSWKDLYGE